MLVAVDWITAAFVTTDSSVVQWKGQATQRPLGSMVALIPANRQARMQSRRPKTNPQLQKRPDERM